MPGTKTYFLTTAIDYVNNLPHIGTAYEKICADVLARFKRLEGNPVFFLMGNDEHSINVKREAQARGLEPHAYCDRMADQFRDIWKRLEISHDAFIRTTEERHIRAVSRLFERIYDNGDIYPSKYTGLYCESCETFYREKDLAEGKCPHHGTEPKWIEEDNYFFALSRYTERVTKIIEEGRLLVLPEVRKNEILNVLRGGLEDISISRSSFDWGIPLPIHPHHVIYVWFDALINYISAVGFGWDEDLFGQFWPADMHVIGKDITRFHCIIWPAMLLSAGLDVPRMVFAHGFVFLKGEKMSKTLGNVVTPMDIIDVYGPDALRYYLLRDSSFGNDGNFTWENFLERYNGELANDFGNLLQRVLTMIRRYRSGTIAAGHTLEPEDEALRKDCLALFPDVRGFLDPARGDIDFHLALARIWETVRRTNQYIDRTAPWNLHKNGSDERLDTVLFCAAESLRIIGTVLFPFLPNAARGLFEQLGLSERPDKVPLGAATAWGRIPPGTKVSKPTPLFPRIVAETEASEATGAPKPDAGSEAKTDRTVTIDEFDRLDLRAARVLDAERVEGTDRLLKLTVDVGETRTLVASIGRAFSPEEIRGRIVVVVANLKPVRIHGILSEGMLLAAGTDNDLALVTLSGEAAPGEKIR
jgi:methionyl-tRNA synthetase